jgi:serine kinase of HPr protein (carbohydrate metabolism regulator)
MFGVKSIRKEKSLDLVVTLKAWDEVPTWTGSAWSRNS